MSAKIISIANRKGGVQKTTITFNLGVALTKKGYKVLLVDLDYSQASLTRSIMEPIVNSDKKGIIHAFLAPETKTEEIVYKTGHKNLFVIPSEETIMGRKIVVEDHIQNDVNKNFILSKILDETITKTFDYILLDNPPALGAITINSLTACDYILIPTLTDDMSTDGIERVINIALEVREHLNPNLDLLGIILTGVDKREKIAKEKRQILTDLVGDKIFKTEIRTNTKFKTLQRKKLSIFDIVKAKDKGPKEYIDLVKEIEHKVKNQKQFADQEVQA